jgi:phage shock protein C
MAAFCSACGGPLGSGARFCSSCGKETPAPGATSFSGAVRPALYRPRTGRKIAGVCQGLANQYGWDVTWTRVITALLVVFAFPVGALAYLLFWLIMPEEPVLVPMATSLDTVS